MTIISEPIKDLAGVGDNTEVIFTTGLRENSAGTGTVTTRRVKVVPVAGVLTTPDLDPGPASVKIGMGKSLPIVIPTSGIPVRLWPLIADYVPYEPPVVSAAQAAASSAAVSAATATTRAAEADTARAAAVAAQTAAEAARAAAEASVPMTDTDLAAAVQTGATKTKLDGSYGRYAQLARTPDMLIAGAITRDAAGAATSAPVVWPDGTPGTYTATTLSAAFPGAVDAYTITYGSPVTKTYTQPAVTRDPTGAVTAVPAIVVN